MKSILELFLLFSTSLITAPSAVGKELLDASTSPPTPLNMNEFRNHTLVELLNEAFTYYNRNWEAEGEAEGEAQKYYCIAKRLFVRRVKRAVRSVRLAYNYIRYIEKISQRMMILG